MDGYVRHRVYGEWTPEETAHAIALSNQGKTAKEIGEVFGISRFTAAGRLKRHMRRMEKIENGETLPEVAPRWTDEDSLKVIELYNTGVRPSLIARQVGVSVKRVMNRIANLRRFPREDLPPILPAVKQPKVNDRKAEQTRRKVVAKLAETKAKASKPKPKSEPARDRELATRARAGYASERVAVRQIETARFQEIDLSIKTHSVGMPLDIAMSRQGCRFAVNNGASGAEHLFCGAPSIPGRAWCEHHHRIVYTPRAA